MFAIISPAKSIAQNVLLPSCAPPLSRPVLTDDAVRLVEVMRKKSAMKIAGLMSISDKLAKLNVERYQVMMPGSTHGTAAGFLFQGDVYQGLEIGALDDDALITAQARLRILSGLYGLLKPFDRIQPYRLEMGTRLKTRRGDTLYKFWGQRITKALKADIAASDAKAVVNLASQEYAHAVDFAALPVPTVVCHFKEQRGDKLKMISFSAKRARGLMARYMLVENVDRTEGLKDFCYEGYRYEPAISDNNQFVFVR